MSRRRKLLINAGIAIALMFWAAGVVTAYIALQNQPEKGYLDTSLDGIEEPKQVKQPKLEQPNKSKNERKTRVKPKEGPCWPTYGRNVRRDSNATDLKHGKPKQRRWRLRVGIMEFPPSYCDGLLYVNSQNGHTSAIRASTGRTVWKKKTAQVYDSTPAISGSRIFVGAFQPGQVKALERRTGRLLWKLKTGGAVESSPIVVDGLVYATSKDHRVYAIDERTGKVKWAFKSGGEVKDSPTYAFGLILFGNYAGEVYALNAKTGAVKWRRSFAGVLGDRIYSSVPIVGTTAYFGTVRGDIYALNVRTGATRWHQSIPGYVYSTPAIANDRLFIGNYPGNLYAFNAKTGRKLWSSAVGGSISGSPVVIGAVVYASSLSGSVTKGFNPRTGKEVWHIDEGRYVPGIATRDAIYFSLGSFLSKWTT